MVIAPISAWALLTVYGGQEAGPAPGALPVAAARPAEDDEPPPRLVIDPESLSFGPVCQGGEKTEKINLRNRGDGVLSITALQVKGRDFRLVSPPSLPATVNPGRALVLNVRFSPSEGRERSRSAVIEVRSNDQDHEQAEIDLDGSIQQSSINIEPRFIEFGETGVGAGCELTRTVTLRNRGNCAVDIEEYRVEGRGSNAISLPEPPLGELAPGSSIETEVAFSCARTVDLSALLSFIDAQGKSQAAISMTGGAH